MAHLTYGTGLAYSKTEQQLTTTFDLDDLFAWASEQPSEPKGKEIQAKIASLMNVKDTNYGKVSQLRESAEFHSACDNNGHPNVVALKKDPRKVGTGNSGPRDGNGLSKSVYEKIGKQVVESMTSKADAETDDHKPNAEWAQSNVDTMLNAIRKDWKPTALPLIAKTDAAKIKQRDESIAATIKALASTGMDAATIASHVPHYSESDIEAILSE